MESLFPSQSFCAAISNKRILITVFLFMLWMGGMLGDGPITASGSAASKVEAEFKRLDANNDGRLILEEVGDRRALIRAADINGMEMEEALSMNSKSGYESSKLQLSRIQMPSRSSLVKPSQSDCLARKRGVGRRQVIRLKKTDTAL